jgi:hypothetical protein
MSAESPIPVKRRVWRISIWDTYWYEQRDEIKTLPSFDARNEVLKDFLSHGICGMPTWRKDYAPDFPIRNDWCLATDRFQKDFWNVFWNIAPGDRVVLVEDSKRVIAKGFATSYAKANKTPNLSDPKGKYPAYVEVKWDEDFSEFLVPEKLQGGGTFFQDLTEEPEELKKTKEINFTNMTRPYVETTNLILCGPPGTGKTFRTKRTACEVCLGPEWKNSRDEDAMSEQFAQLTQGDNPRVVFVTFHPNYDYSDFIEGFRPVGSGFALQDGALVSLAKRALAHPENNYLLIIDEINRGNIAKIFGEIITLLEEDKRIGGDFELHTVLPASRERFGLPSNLYIRGTMNTADRSIAMLDIALRRRFEFEEVQPDPDLLKGADIKTADGVIKQSDLMANLNELLLKKEILGNRDYQIGHAWFAMPKKGKNKESADALAERLVTRFRKKIAPLLQEWMYETPEKLWGSKDDEGRSVFGGIFKQDDPSTISADNLYKLQEHLKAALKKTK